MPNRKKYTFPSGLIANAGFAIVFIAYIGLLVALLLSELGILEWLRATNQVLVLLGLLFLPFLLLALAQAITSFTLKLPGQDIEVEISRQVQNIQSKVDEVKNDVSVQISTAEQALWPILAGRDITAADRLQQKRLIIGSKLDSSQVFFAHFLADWIENTVSGTTCELRVPNGGSLKNFADLQNNWIDMYIDFTGTCLQFFNIDHQGKSLEELIGTLNQYGSVLGLRWMRPLGASEGYCIVMHQETAEKYGISEIADLRWAAHELVFSADPEFLNRKDCYLGLASKYNLHFLRVEPCNITARYELLNNKIADVFVGYETDPELYQPRVFKLTDAEPFFPSYEAIPLVSQKALDSIPGLFDSLLKLERIITTKQLINCIFELRQRNFDPAAAREIAQKVRLSITGSNGK